MRTEINQIHGGDISIRRLGEADRAAVELLAELDSSRNPEAPMIGVEVEGRLLAATSLTSGEMVADPFSQTSELRSLLELRSAQLRQRGERQRGAAGRAPRRARGALAGSPPGAGGRLLALLPRI